MKIKKIYYIANIKPNGRRGYTHSLHFDSLAQAKYWAEQYLRHCEKFDWNDKGASVEYTKQTIITEKINED